MICGSGGSKSRLPKAAGAEPCGQMRGAKHNSKSEVSKTVRFEPLLEVDRSKSASSCGGKHISKSKCQKHNMFGSLLTAQMGFCLAGARACAPCHK